MKQFIDHITARLLPCYPEDEARSLAWWIAEELTGLSRSQLLCGYKGTTNFPNTQDIVERLLHFEPIQYIFGHTLWNGLDLRVTPATLIPRPETAELVELISNFKFQISNFKSSIRVLDIGTGSGCIAIALKKAHPEWQVTGIDISPEAIEIARENARRNQVEVDFRVADIFSDQMAKSLHQWYLVNDQMVNVIVSNPPYICESERSSMRANVLNYEPSSALFVPDSDPLRFYRRIAGLFHPTPHTVHPTPYTFLFFEINEAFGEELSILLSGLGYRDIQLTKDIYGKDRIIEARMA